MACRRVNQLMVTAHGTATPTNEEWEEMLAIYREADADSLRMLVHTDGATPNALQRSRLKETLGDAQPRIAVLSNSPLARTVGTAIGWFNKNFRVFDHGALEAAFEHLRLSNEERDQARALLAELRIQVAPARKTG